MSTTRSRLLQLTCRTAIVTAVFAAPVVTPGCSNFSFSIPEHFFGSDHAETGSTLEANRRDHRIVRHGTGQWTSVAADASVASGADDATPASAAPGGSARGVTIPISAFDVGEASPAKPLVAPASQGRTRVLTTAITSDSEQATGKIATGSTKAEVPLSAVAKSEILSQGKLIRITTDQTASSPMSEKQTAPQTDKPAAVPAAKPAENPDSLSLAERAARLFLDTEEPTAELASDSATQSVRPAVTQTEPSRLAAETPAPDTPDIQDRLTRAETLRTSSDNAAKTADPTYETHRGALPVASVERTPLAPVDSEELARAANTAPAAGPARLPHGDVTDLASFGPPTPLLSTPGGPSVDLEPAQTTIVFDGQSAVLSNDAQKELSALADRVSEAGKAKVTILGYAEGGGQANAASQARIVSLSRVLAVRQFLMVRGLSGHLLVGRAMGQQTAQSPSDRVDILIGRL